MRSAGLSFSAVPTESSTGNRVPSPRTPVNSHGSPARAACSNSGNTSYTRLPIRSVVAYPNIFTAAGLAAMIRPCCPTVMMLSGAVDTIARTRASLSFSALRALRCSSTTMPRNKPVTASASSMSWNSVTDMPTSCVEFTTNTMNPSCITAVPNIAPTKPCRIAIQISGRNSR